MTLLFPYAGKHVVFLLVEICRSRQYSSFLDSVRHEPTSSKEGNKNTKLIKIKLNMKLKSERSSLGPNQLENE